MSFYNNRKAFEKKALVKQMQKVSEYVAPNLIASFCLTLYDNTDMSTDDIHYLCSQVEDLWVRSTDEGWDIRQNCFDLTGIDVRRYSETGQIIYLEKYKPMTMAQKAEFKHQERLGIA